MIRVLIYNENGLLKEAELSSTSFFLGRSKRVDISVQDELLSRKHIEFKVDENKIVIKDLSTTNGTYLNKKRIPSEQWTEVAENQRISIGEEHKLFFMIEFDEDEETNIFEFSHSGPNIKSVKKAQFSGGKSNYVGNNAHALNPREQIFDDSIEHGVQTMINKVDNDSGTEFSEIELLEIKKIEIDAQVKALKLKEESELEAKILLDRAHQDSEKMLNDAEDEAEEIFAETQSEVEALKKSSQIKAEELLSNAEFNSKKILREATEQSEKLLRVSEKSSKTQVTEAKLEADRLVRLAREESENSLRKATQDAQFELDQAREKSKNLIRDAEDQKESIVSTARKEAEKINSDAKDEYHRLTRKVEEIYQERNELTEKTRELREDLKNSKDLKVDCEKDVTTLKREIQALNSELSLLQDKHDESLKEFDHRKTNLLEQSDELNQTITILKKVREDEQSEAERVEKNLFNIREELENAKLKEEQIIDSINKNEEWLEKIYNDKKKLTEESKEVEEKFNKLANEVSTHEMRLTHLTDLIDSKESYLQDIEAKALDFFNEEKSKHEANLAELIAIDNKAFEDQKEKNYKIAKDIIGKAKFEANKLEEETNALLEKTIRNEKELSDLKYTLEHQADEETAKLNVELDELRAKAQIEASSIKEKALTEYETAIKTAKDKSDNIIEEAENSAHEKVLAAEASSKELLQMSRNELDKVHEQVKETLEFAKNKAKKIEEDGHIAVKKKQDLVGQQHQQIENELKEIVKRKENIENEARLLESNLEQEKAKILAEAQTEAAEIKSKSEELLELAQKDAQSVKEKLLEEAEREIAENQELAKKKAEDKLRKEKNAIAKLRAQEIEKLKELKSGEEKALNDRKIEYAETIARGLQNLVNTKVQEACGKKSLEEKVKLELDKIDYLVKTSLLEKNPENNQMLKKLNPYGKTGKGRSTLLMKRLAIGGGIISFLIILHFIFPNLYSSMTNSVSNQVAIKESAKDIYLKQLQDKVENAPKFEPRMTDAFKGNYTDNLIYTNRFSDLWLSDQLQKEWTIKVDEIIVYKLELKDYKVVQYIAEEFKVIRELNNMKNKIRFDSQDEQISEMKKIENLRIKTLIDLLDGEKNYKRMLAEQKKFFLQFRSTNP